MANKLENRLVCQFHEKLYLNPEISDVNFIFDNDKVPSHKVILAAGSPVFQQMFFGSMKEMGNVSITDVSADAFKEFLQFFYLKKVTLAVENIEEVAYLADKYDMLSCVKSCASFLKDQLTIDKMCWGYQLATMLNIDDLIAYCEEEICIHIKTVFESESFKRCSIITLKNILAMESLLCDEADVFKACLIWAKFACKKNCMDEKNGENLRIQLRDCFYSIRFGAMSIEEFSANAAPYKDVFKLEEFKDILFAITKKEPSNFKQTPRLGPLISWNDAIKLTCTRWSQSSQYSSFYIHAAESVWFSTNALVVLGEIWFTSIQSREQETIFVMSVFEVNSTSFSAPKKRLMTENVKLNRNVVKHSLRKKLLVNPQNMYEIRMESSAINGCYHNSLWHSNVEVDKNLKVKFYQNSKLIEKERRGLVHSLLFNHYIWPKRTEQLTQVD